VRTAILHVLHEQQQLNGYQVIQQITERSRGAWKPSPGSVYPTIAQLEDEGLIETVVEGGRKLLQLTAAGSAYVADHQDELAAVWEAFEEDGKPGDTGLKPVIGQLMGAVWQIVTTGTPGQQQRAAEILADARRELYGLLADGPDDDFEEE
jgi:DNA-binding PadR family transcriptional regulator